MRTDGTAGEHRRHHRKQRAQILQVGHHGSRTSSSPEFLAAVQPEVAIYSAAAGNSYGHPHPETIANLIGAGAEFFGTDVNGTVVVVTDGRTYEVLPSRADPAGEPSATPMPPTAAPVAVRRKVGFLPRMVRFCRSSRMRAVYQIGEKLPGL